MSDPYIEDDGDEFPINSRVRCGQAAVVLGFANMTADDASGLNPRVSPQRRRPAKFVPRVVVPKR
ncbi:hypothetical protein [Pseudomonas defluvii]|uniref:hypothetical protein n=1 Tax=Pseudomonas defluvii TaxID=1876757 RepID=UPI003906CAD1